MSETRAAQGHEALVVEDAADRAKRAPPPPPRPGGPFGLVLRGTRAAWMGAFFAVAMLAAGTVASRRGKYDTLYLSGPLGAMAAVACIVGVVLRRRDLALWRDGTVAEGVVLRSWTEKNRNAGDTHWVEYEYRVGERTFVDVHQTFGRIRRREIWALYDPRRPERSIPQERHEMV
jgi:hypothetical protein